jgi:glycosyltransferase involved in cell wall biosynthesis
MNLLRPSDRQFINFPADEPPRILVTVDAEEEFDWRQPVSRRLHTVASMQSQWKTEKIFQRYNVSPTYLIDYPVAVEKAATERLAELCREKCCSIGAHLHPWTNPPHEEIVSSYTSFPGNLDPDLEKRKLCVLTEAIERNLGARPVVYKAGRYGIGPSTAAILNELGYKVDMSSIPLRDYSRFGGPNFSKAATAPYWFGANEDMLEIPLTAGFIGMLRRAGPNVAALFNSPTIPRLRIPGILARAGLLNRVFITPEGTPLEEAKRLTRTLIAAGQRVFMLNYHSPSLQPGNTPYVRSDAELKQFLHWLEAYLDFFTAEVGGIGATPMQVYDRASELRRSADLDIVARGGTTVRYRIISAAAPHAEKPIAAPKCLLIASNFPPARGGSAMVYGSLAKFGQGSIIVLSASRSYATGEEIAGWVEHDRAAAFPIFRMPFLRPALAAPHRRIPKFLSLLVEDIPLMLRVLGKVISITRTYDIPIICIGELVYGGWIAIACRLVLRRKVIQYIHGEEITVSGNTRAERMKRIYLNFSDAVVAVSRFTQAALINQMAVDPVKIALIENGVDLERFKEKPRIKMLLKRYGLFDKRVILSTGRLVERKGFDRMLAALPLILDHHPAVHYIIVGDGPYRPRLEALALEHGVVDFVTFAGDVPDAELADYYALCDLFIMPNREMPNGDTEGFGLVFLEANACGKPVISGRAGGVVDAVRDGANGLTVDGNDPATIAVAVHRLLTDPALYAKLRAGGLAAAERSSWENRIKQFHDLYSRLVASDA